MVDFIKYSIDLLLHIISAWGYPGIVVLMALESSLVPIPSEVVMIPAGYLAAKGEMDLLTLLFCGTLGSVLGAWINYYLALYLGRPIFVKYGKYLGMSEHHLERVETFFYRHGEISTFVGRLLPVIRHLATIPAGFARMSLWKLTFYTALGSALWTAVLIAVGYFAGSDPALQHDLLAKSSTYLIIGLVLMVVGYIAYQRTTTSTTHRISVSKEYFDMMNNESRNALLSAHDRIGKKDSICLIEGAREETYMIIKQLKAVSSEHTSHLLRKEGVSERLIQIVLKNVQESLESQSFFAHANIYLLKPLSKGK